MKQVKKSKFWKTWLSQLGCRGNVNVDVHVMTTLKCSQIILRQSRHVLVVIPWTVLKLFHFSAKGGSKSPPRLNRVKGNKLHYIMFMICGFLRHHCIVVTFTICTQCRFFVFHVPNKAFNKLRPGVDRMRKVFATTVWHPFYLLSIKGFFKDVNMAYQTNKLSSLGIFFCQILCQANNKFTSSCRT